MNKQQAENEIRFRIALLYLQKIFEEKLIDDSELKKLKKKLIRKYKPIIGWLEVIE
jgi:hypothetical protein